MVSDQQDLTVEEMATTRRVATVFGGSGFIGRYVVARLAKLDYVVRVPTRSPAGSRELSTQGRVGQIVPLLAELSEDASIARAVQGADVAINLIGILAEGHDGDFRRLHAEVPGRIARAAALSGATRFVQLSAIGADAGSGSAYARSKAEGEAAVRAAFPAATILRPSVVFGPEDHFFNRFAGMARILPVLPVVGAETIFQPVYVGDVAEAVVAACVRSDAEGKTFELAGPRAASFRSLLEYMLEVIGRHRRIVELPAGLARFQAALFEKLPNPPLTRDQIIMLGVDNVASGQMPGLADLGIVPRAMEGVLPGYLARFRQGGGRRASFAN